MNLPFSLFQVVIIASSFHLLLAQQPFRCYRHIFSRPCNANAEYCLYVSCLAKLADENTCVDHSQCLSGLCEDNICGGIPEGKTKCSLRFENEDCDSESEYCSFPFCKTKEDEGVVCGRDTHCSSGFCNSTFPQEGVCEPLPDLDNSEPCNRHVVCASGYCEKNVFWSSQGVCAIDEPNEDGGLCYIHEDCVSLYCEKALPFVRGTCAQQIQEIPMDGEEKEESIMSASSSVDTTFESQDQTCFFDEDCITEYCAWEEFKLSGVCKEKPDDTATVDTGVEFGKRNRRLRA